MSSDTPLRDPLRGMPLLFAAAPHPPPGSHRSAPFIPRPLPLSDKGHPLPGFLLRRYRSTRPLQ